MTNTVFRNLAAIPQCQLVLAWSLDFSLLLRRRRPHPQAQYHERRQLQGVYALFMCMCACMRVCMCECVCMCVYVCVCVSMYECVYVLCNTYVVCTCVYMCV